jgi:hypothetical protein
LALKPDPEAPPPGDERTRFVQQLVDGFQKRPPEGIQAAAAQLASLFGDSTEDTNPSLWTLRLHGEIPHAPPTLANLDACGALSFLAQEFRVQRSPRLDAETGRLFSTDACAQAEVFFRQRPDEMARFRIELAQYVRETYDR